VLTLEDSRLGRRSASRKRRTPGKVLYVYVSSPRSAVWLRGGYASLSSIVRVVRCRGERWRAIRPIPHEDEKQGRAADVPSNRVVIERAGIDNDSI
jgi:hypothetical protein